MELSTIQVPVQQGSAREPRKRVRNWRNKLPESQTPVATFNDSTSVIINNLPELDPKAKTSPKSNDKVQKSPKLDAVDKASLKSSNQASPKLSGTTSPEPNVQVPPETGSQGSPKANVQAPPPVTRGKSSPKSNEQAFFTKSNNKNSSGPRNKRRRDKGAGFKNNTDYQQNSQYLKANVSGEASKSDFSKNKDYDTENQVVPTMVVQVTKTIPSSSDRPDSGKVINDQVPIVEKHKVIEPTKNKELQSDERSEKDQSGLDKHAVIEQGKPGAEQQTIKDRSIQDRQESQLKLAVEGNVSSNELTTTEEESTTRINEANPQLVPNIKSEIIACVKDLRVPDNEKDAQREKVEIPAKKAENVCITESQGIAKRGLPAGCLFVASLPSIKSDGELQKSIWNHFSRWGTLLNVKVLKDWLYRPYSFVQFENVCDARQALVEAHNTVIEGRHIRVEQARVNRTLFVGRLNRTMSEEDISKLLEPYGATEDIHLLRTYSTGKSRGCAFVKFCYRDDAIKAYINLRQHASNYVIEWAANLEKAVPGPEDIDKRSIFVGQLNQVEVTKELLVEKFSCYGGIKEIQYIVRKFFRASGPPRSAFAFIYYNDEEASKKAIEAENNTKYFDRIIRVQYRESQEFRNQQIQLLRQQQEIRRKAFQDSYYNATLSSGRHFIKPPPLSRGHNYYANAQKTSGRRNSIVPKEMPILSTPVFYPQASMGVHQVGHNKNGNQEPKGKGPEVSHMQNNAVSNMVQPELIQYYPPPPVPTSIPTSVGMIPGYTGSQEFTMPPYVHTPEGLTYPYAPSMAFMGTINHNNAASYVRDGVHETTSATASKVPLPPNILHSYAPPYVPGQPVNEYGFADVAGHSTQYCGVPIPIQITMPPPMYFYPSPPIDPGYTVPHSKTLEESASGYEADIEINTHSADEEKTAVGEIAKVESSSGSKVLDDGIYTTDVDQDPLAI